MCDCLLLLRLRGKIFYEFSLKTPQHVIITQRSASESNAAGPVRSTIANKTVILERHLVDKMLKLPNLRCPYKAWHVIFNTIYPHIYLIILWKRMCSLSVSGAPPSVISHSDISLLFIIIIWKNITTNALWFFYLMRNLINLL